MNSDARYLTPHARETPAPASGGRPRSRTDRAPPLFGDLELHRSLGVLLHDNRAWGDMTALEHIADVKPH